MQDSMYLLVTFTVLSQFLDHSYCTYLSPFSNIGSNQLYNLKVSGVSEVVAKHSGVARKGVRAHFHLDDSGLVNVTSVEAAFERTVSVEEQGGNSSFWDYVLA